MAIDSVEKRRCVAGNMPIPDGTISAHDRRQVAGNYRGFPLGISLAGTLTSAGALSRALDLKRNYGGSITPSATLAVLVTPLPLPGGITPTGALSRVAIYVQNVGGTLTLSGSLTANNPAWILIPDYLNWQGVWVTTTSYERDDLVLYQDGDLIHAFVSKTSHNVGNVPTTAYQHWTRLVQEKWE